MLLNKLLVLIFPLLCYSYVNAQANLTEKKINSRTIYFAFGTNRSFYSNSDITLKSAGDPAYNFTLYDVRGKDDGRLRFDKGAPQYSYQLGYYNNKKSWGIEFNFDHIKYYVRQSQRVQMKGSIEDKTYNIDTLINPNFIQLEHTDGGNYALLKGVYWKPLVEDKRGNTILNLVLKAGAGPVIPKTNSTIMGKHRDDKYNIAGYVIALEGGLRYNLLNFMFVEVNVKGAHANYSHLLIADGTGSQRWWGLHLALLLGLQLAK